MSDPYRNPDPLNPAPYRGSSREGNTTAVITGIAILALIVIGGLMYAANNANVASNSQPNTSSPATTGSATNTPSANTPAARPEPSGTPPAPTSPPATNR